MFERAPSFAMAKGSMLKMQAHAWTYSKHACRSQGPLSALAPVRVWMVSRLAQ